MQDFLKTKFSLFFLSFFSIICIIICCFFICLVFENIYHPVPVLFFIALIMLLFSLFQYIRLKQGKLQIYKFLTIKQKRFICSALYANLAGIFFASMFIIPLLNGTLTLGLGFGSNSWSYPNLDLFLYISAFISVVYGIFFFIYRLLRLVMQKITMNNFCREIGIAFCLFLPSSFLFILVLGFLTGIKRTFNLLS